MPATTHSDGVPPSAPLRSLCRDVKTKIEAFLAEDIETEILKRVQEQTRLSLRVIQEALQRYEYDFPPRCSASVSG